MRPVYFPIWAAMWCASGASAAVIPDCAGPVEIRSGHVVRVEKNGALSARAITVSDDRRFPVR